MGLSLKRAAEGYEGNLSDISEEDEGGRGSRKPREVEAETEAEVEG
jgi:hypothetical protein